MRRPSVPRRVLLALLAAAGAVQVVPTGAAGAATPTTTSTTAAPGSDLHEQVVDLRFPADPRSRYANDYEAPRSRGTHGATDLMGQKGWGVYAAVGGRITSAPGSDGAAMPSYGYMVSIAGDDGRKYSYIHLNNDTPGTDDGKGGPVHAFAPGIGVGKRVARGQLIGYVGDSGNAEATAPHLHFEIDDPKVLDPHGTHRINPYFSLKAAQARGDVPAVGVAAAGPTGARTVERSCPVVRVPRHRFADVPAGSTHDLAVACAVWWSVAKGLEPGRFGPDLDVTRGQMATLVARLVVAAGGTLPSSPANRFTDDNGSAHELSINRLAAAGVVGGVAATRFAPDEPVTRAQMASFLVRAYEHASKTVLPAGRDAFSDDDGGTHAGRIDQAAAAGFAAGVAPGTFAPERNVTRAQVTSFVVRVLDLAVDDGRARTP